MCVYERDRDPVGCHCGSLRGEAEERVEASREPVPRGLRVVLSFSYVYSGIRLTLAPGSYWFPPRAIVPAMELILRNSR